MNKQSLGWPRRATPTINWTTVGAALCGRPRLVIAIFLSLASLAAAKENVDWALYKLGQYVEEKNQHKTIVIIGNEATGLWKKAFGLASADELIRLVEEVANDKGVDTK